MREYLSIVFITFSFIITVSGQDCPFGWSTQRNNPAWPCYLMTNKVQRTWQKAQEFCEGMGGGLLKIDSQTEKDWVFNVLGSYQKIYLTHTEWWIGLHDNPAQTGVMWTDRSVPNPALLNWVAGEPASYDHTNACVEYYNGSIRHQHCSSQQYFVCERARQNAVFCDARNRWESINNKCYKVMAKLRTWDDARGECQAENGDLFVVTDSSTEQVLYNFIQSRHTDMWIGVRAYQTPSSPNNPLFRLQGPTGSVLKDLNSYWGSHSLSAVTQDVVASNGTRACVIANHTYSNPNVWQNVDCSIKSFSICQKAQGACASGWIRSGNYCYLLQSRTRLSWQGASDYCQSRGSQLLKIDSNATQQFINFNLANFHSQGIASLWLGLYANSSTGSNWQWSTGQNISSFNNFDNTTRAGYVIPGKPNCVVIYTDNAKGTWQASTVCGTNRTFMCNLPLGVSPVVPTLPPGVTVSTLYPATTAAPANWSSECGPFWVNDKTTGYCYKLSDNTLTWFQAKSSCEGENAQLASINTAHEQDFIADRLFGYTTAGLWLGGNDLDSSRGYHWIDGSGFGYINWAPGEPNYRFSTEHCMELITGGRIRAGAWNDNTCTHKRGYICKKRMTSFAPVAPPTPPVVPANKIYGCPNQYWKGYQGHCFLFMNTSTNWYNANTFCKSHGFQLASIASENEFNFVVSQLPPYHSRRDQYWLGLTDMDIQMSFKWTDTTPVTFTYWAATEPNNWQNRKEDCVTMLQESSEWNDESCDNPQNGFICKTTKAVLPGKMPQISTNTGCSHPDFLAYGYSCYKIVRVSASWTSAKSQCISLGGHLAVINDRYQQAFLASQIIFGSATLSKYWIGLSTTSSGRPTWTGTFLGSVGYTAWSSAHTGNENSTCVYMGVSSPGVGLWRHGQCSDTNYYICETPRSSYSTPSVPTTTTVTPAVCPTMWHEFKGYCYKGYTNQSDQRSWLGARDMCRSMRADLVSIHSYQELQFAHSHTTLTGSHHHGFFIGGWRPLPNSYWIGLNDFDVEKGYKWSDGSAVNYTRWGTGEPNDADGTDDCVEYNKQADNWNDNNCYIAKPYVCKIRKGDHLRTPSPTVSPTPSSDCAGLPGWKSYNDSCYFVSQTTGRMSWFDAKDYCMLHSGNLVSVHSDQENGFVVNLVSLTVKADIWLGLNDLGVNQFGWTDGTVFDYFKWNGGEPNDAFGSEKCGQMKATTGYWNDNDCSEEYHFVCKAPPNGRTRPVSTPPTTITPGGCPTGFTPVPYNNKCYQFVGIRNTGDRKNYTSARDACRAMGNGVDIASINSHQELAGLVSMGLEGMLLDNTGLWIGLNDINSNRKFTWQDSSRLQLTNWDKGEPQRSGGNCVEFYTDERRAGKWHNIRCRDVRGFVCEAQRNASIHPTKAASMCKIPGYVTNGLDCYKVNTVPLSWTMAKAACQRDGTQLTSVLSIFEQDYIDAITYNLKSPIWIGLGDPTVAGTYYWADNFDVTFTSWDIGEPSQEVTDRCVMSRNGVWDDQDCSHTYPYVCKQPFFNPPTRASFPTGYCADITWRQFGDYCYFVNIKTTMSWTNADHDCASKGMQLASISSKAEETFILHEVDTDAAMSLDVWTGLRKNGGYFGWSDSSPTSYMNWAGSSGPSGAGSCVSLLYTSGKWKDLPCTNHKGYVCKASKLSATSPPPTTTTQSTPSTASTVTLSSPSSKPSAPSTARGPVLPQSQSSKPTSSSASLMTSSSQPVKQSSSQTTPKPQINNIPNNSQKQKQDASKDLTGGQITGVVVGTLLVLMLVCALLLFMKHRSNGSLFQFRQFKNDNSGFDNAAYDKTVDAVKLNGHTNGKVHTESSDAGYVNGLKFTDDSEMDA